MTEVATDTDLGTQFIEANKDIARLKAEIEEIQTESSTRAAEIARAHASAQTLEFGADLLRQLDQEIKFRVREQKRKINELGNKISDIERILAFIRIRTDRDLAIDAQAIKVETFRYLEPLDLIVDEAMLKIRLFAVENRKRGLSLVALGKSAFPPPLLTLPKTPVSYFDTEGDYDLVLVVADYNSIGELKQMLRAPFWGALADRLKGPYSRVVEEYRQAIANHKLEDFAAITWARCPSCAYLLTELDEVERGEEVECPACHHRPMTILKQEGEQIEAGNSSDPG